MRAPKLATAGGFAARETGWAMRGLAGFETGLLAGSLLTVLLLFSVPGILLGTGDRAALRRLQRLAMRSGLAFAGPFCALALLRQEEGLLPRLLERTGPAQWRGGRLWLL